MWFEEKTFWHRKIFNFWNLKMQRKSFSSLFSISKYPLYVLQKSDKLNSTVGTKHFQKTQFILTFTKGLVKWLWQHLLFILIMIYAPVICRRHNSLRNVCTLCSWSFGFWQHFKARIISQSFRTQLSFSKTMCVRREGRRVLGPLDFENFCKNMLFSWFWVGETKFHTFGHPRNFWKIFYWPPCKKIFRRTGPRLSYEFRFLNCFYVWEIN